MHVDVAICTWNRAKLLDQTLESMRALQIPAHVEWELIVVNNHSTDETDEVIARHEPHLPLRRLWEPTLGKSSALNAAIDSLRGELVLWTDDDVMVDPRWLAEHVAAADRYPHVAFFGGTIAPWYEVDPPSWTTDAWDYISAAYAARELDDRVFSIDATTLPFGANWAIRTDVQRRYPYDCRLGRVGPTEVRGEETAVLHQLLADGHQGYWIPQAKLEHFIPKERLTLDFLQRFFFGIGQTAALVAEDHSLSATRLTLRRLLYRAKLATYKAKYLMYRHTTSPARWVKSLARASHYSGRLACLENPPNSPVPPDQEATQDVRIKKKAA